MGFFQAFFTWIFDEIEEGIMAIKPTKLEETSMQNTHTCTHINFSLYKCFCAWTRGTLLTHALLSPTPPFPRFDFFFEQITLEDLKLFDFNQFNP